MSQLDFLAVGISAFLDADARPTVVLDLHDFEDLHSENFRPVFTNKAFQTLTASSPKIFTDPSSSEPCASYLAFRLWTVSHGHHKVRQGDSHELAGFKWQQFEISGRWRIITTFGTASEELPVIENAAV